MNYQFTSKHLTLDNFSRSNQGHMTFKRLYLLNGASYQILHETHIYNKSYMVLVYLMTFDLGIERSNQFHWAVHHRKCIIRQQNCQAERPLVFI